MNKFLKCFSIAALAASITSCGGDKKEEVKEESLPTNKLDALIQAGEQMEKSADKGAEKMKERRAKGDTLAMPYADLQKYLPATIDGYTTGQPDGATINMGPMSYSSAEIKYKKDGNWIKITIIDYNQAHSLYSAATAMWAMGMTIDTPEEKAGGIKLGENIGGWEAFKKKRKEAALVLGVGSRFWVSIEADKQENTDFIKSIAKSIDLKKLSLL